MFTKFYKIILAYRVYIFYIIYRNNKKEDKPMTKIELYIKRPNGNTEVVDVSNKFPGLGKAILVKIKDATKKAGKGDVEKAVITRDCSNIQKLMRNYNNVNNEGGEGYMPEPEYFKALPQYKAWTETETIYA